MSPTHHLPDELLLDYGTGASPEALAVVTATHLSFCSGCRHEVDRVETVGGVLLDSLPPAEVPGRVLEAVMARLDDEPQEPAPTPRPPSPWPEPLAPYLDGKKWRWVVPGISQMLLEPKLAGRPLRLLRFKPGLALSEHGHGGKEVSVVLTGGFTDGGAHYAPGDVAVADPELTHRPVIDEGEDCVILVAGEGPSLPTGTLGRFIAKIIG